ncbi:MAG: hypothetical protein M0R40_04095 [Firmicutes bacterium]|nr:hypothetical protein [Bacillota bacterium]
MFKKTFCLAAIFILAFQIFTTASPAQPINLLSNLPVESSWASSWNFSGTGGSGSITNLGTALTDGKATWSDPRLYVLFANNSDKKASFAYDFGAPEAINNLVFCGGYWNNAEYRDYLIYQNIWLYYCNDEVLTEESIWTQVDFLAYKDTKTTAANATPAQWLSITFSDITARRIKIEIGAGGGDSGSNPSGFRLFEIEAYRNPPLELLVTETYGQLSAGNAFNVFQTVKNNSAPSATAVSTVAIFNSDNKLVDVAMSSGTSLSTSDPTRIGIGFAALNPAVDSDSYAKIFIWDGLTNILPHFKSRTFRQSDNLLAGLEIEDSKTTDWNYGGTMHAGTNLSGNTILTDGDKTTDRIYLDYASNINKSYIVYNIGCEKAINNLVFYAGRFATPLTHNNGYYECLIPANIKLFYCNTPQFTEWTEISNIRSEETKISEGIGEGGSTAQVLSMTFPETQIRRLKIEIGSGTGREGGNSTGYGYRIFEIEAFRLAD